MQLTAMWNSSKHRSNAAPPKSLLSLWMGCNNAVLRPGHCSGQRNKQPVHYVLFRATDGQYILGLLGPAQLLLKAFVGIRVRAVPLGKDEQPKADAR